MERRVCVLILIVQARRDVNSVLNSPRENKSVLCVTSSFKILSHVYECQGCVTLILYFYSLKVYPAV